jgi:hypothetical protein
VQWAVHARLAWPLVCPNTKAPMSCARPRPRRPCGAPATSGRLHHAGAAPAAGWQVGAESEGWLAVEGAGCTGAACGGLAHRRSSARSCLLAGWSGSRSEAPWFMLSPPHCTAPPTHTPCPALPGQLARLRWREDAHTPRQRALGAVLGRPWARRLWARLQARPAAGAACDGRRHGLRERRRSHRGRAAAAAGPAAQPGVCSQAARAEAAHAGGPAGGGRGRALAAATWVGGPWVKSAGHGWGWGSPL